MLRITSMIGLILLAAVSLAHAQPTTVSYQGSLMKGSGSVKPVFDGAAEFRFAIVCDSGAVPAQIVWNSDAGSPQIGEPVASITVDVDRGVFSVLLGDGNLGMPPLTASVLEGCATPMLRVWVDTGDGMEQLPDQVISSGAFALLAESATSGGVGDADWVEDAGNVHRLSGNVGIGTDAPQNKLHVLADPALQFRLQGSGSPNYWDIYHNALGGVDNGLRFKLSGGSQYLVLAEAPRGCYFPTGNVGIGVTHPTEKLQVGGNLEATGFVRAGPGASTTDGQTVLSLNIERAWSFRQKGSGASAALNLVSIGGGGNKDFEITTDGSFIVNTRTRTQVLEITGGADIAEPFALADESESVVPGSVLVIDANSPGRLRLSDRAYDRQVAGVVSGANGINTGMTLQQNDVFDHGENVALMGRVYALASTSNGSIEPGDLLTTSDLAGHAMKADDRDRRDGAVLGKAMTGLESGEGYVLVLVGLQ